MALPAHQPAATGFPQGHVAFSLRKPQAADGAVIHRLIAACPPLDVNSLYCNLLQASHFADCCILAEETGQVVGWVSGYRLPADPRTLFVWQVAVDPAVRGRGLGRHMLTALLARPDLGDITTITTTITPSNRASWALFQGFADSLGAPLRHDAHFDRDCHLAGTQESERLVTIGPLPAMRAVA
ncbi:diaminobutyrate acetyltransferase [Niveispirillum sp. SYP-B3756]|uniref:diaminobutyrate acetyltransferase n=1 Tax=Niveispirillum sp. SYP-B3756 TaxID=2662178 RepID=UPI001290FF10|nr:diaminobutyrate acetyltransferase [Niveispirillum sp. SYP-B3756]MQP67386.1 diaminobutyrate acetyltransferase [Niveispirillum sp. SYP-B3756]